MPGERPVEAVGLIETDLFIEGVYRQFGVDYRGFDRHAMHAKLGQLRERESVPSVSALQGKVLHDPAYARQAMHYLSAGGGAFMTSPSAFMALRLAVLPVLRSQSWPVVWLAECADPEFVVQMAVMLEQEGLLGKTQVFVTNANEDVLRELAALRLTPGTGAAREASHARGGAGRPVAQYVEEEPGGATLCAALRENIVWAQYDLASDASFKEFHLIVCQRPLRDFALPLQRRALSIFSQSLANFGILQLEPPVGVLGADLARDFTCLLSEQGIYRKVP